MVIFQIIPQEFIVPQYYPVINQEQVYVKSEKGSPIPPASSLVLGPYYVHDEKGEQQVAMLGSPGNSGLSHFNTSFSSPHDYKYPV